MIAPPGITVPSVVCKFIVLAVAAAAPATMPSPTTPATPVKIHLFLFLFLFLFMLVSCVLARKPELKRFRCGDTSILPTQPKGNPNAP